MMYEFLKRNQKYLIASAALVSSVYIWYTPAAITWAVKYFSSFMAIKNFRYYFNEFL